MKRLGPLDLRAVVVAWFEAGLVLDMDSAEAMGELAGELVLWRRRHGWDMAESYRD